MKRQKIQYTDQISIYDLWDIMMKYKKQILVILVVGFALSFGGALVARKFRKEYTTQEYRVKYLELESNPYYQMAKINYVKFNPKEVLEDEKYIDRFLAVPALKEIYEEQKPANPKEILFNKRKFIKEIISIREPKKGEMYKTISVALKDGVVGADKILNVYFEILEEEIPNKIISLAEIKKTYAQKSNKEAKEKLEILQDRVKALLNHENLKVSNKTDMISLLALENPILVSEIEIYDKLFSETSKELVGINYLKENTSRLKSLVDRKETLLIERGSSKAKIVLLIGAFLSFALAFMYVFIAEMKAGYKAYRKEKQNEMIK